MGSDPLLDLSVLEHLLGGDWQQMRKFAGKFLHTAASDLEEIDAALAAGDHAMLRHLGHRARAAALTVGAHAMAALYLRLERLPGDAQDAIESARSLLARLRETLALTAHRLRAAGLA